MAQLFDIQPASRHIGGHQQVGYAISQASHHLVTHLLGHATVQRFSSVTAAVHCLGELVDLSAGAAKHDCGHWRFNIQNAAQRSGLV